MTTSRRKHPIGLDSWDRQQHEHLLEARKATQEWYQRLITFLCDDIAPLLFWGRDHEDAISNLKVVSSWNYQGIYVPVIKVNIRGIYDIVFTKNQDGNAWVAGIKQLRPGSIPERLRDVVDDAGRANRSKLKPTTKNLPKGWRFNKIDRYGAESWRTEDFRFVVLLPSDLWLGIFLYRFLEMMEY